MNAKLNATASTWNDPDDAPELTDDFFQSADLYNGENLVRRGRPRSLVHKESLTVRYDADVVAYFRSTGQGWQSRMNEALKQWIIQHPLA